jgi:DNA repair protein SbcC/Rad50
MIPLQLTIQGLYSYRQKQTIDFTKLTEAHLFGIFGPVGSGKSSILEAVTFALFGKTDRLNLSGDNRNYNMMNLKSDELLIDFRFEAGSKRTVYRATVKGRRNSKRFEEVRTLDRTAYRLDGETWRPVEISALEDAVGLSYENFKRTIIIPQGQFQEFLQLGNKDRTRMMKELFNLEKFELFSKVSSLESKNNEEIQNINGQLQQLGEIDPDRIIEYEKTLKRIKDEIEILDKKLNTYRDEEAKYKQIKELSDKLTNAMQNLASLKEKEPEFIELEKSIRQYEKCVLNFKNILDNLDEGNKKIENKTRQIEDYTLRLGVLQDKLLKDESFLSEIKPKYDGREQLKRKAEELSKLLKTEELNEKIVFESGRLTKGTGLLDQLEDKIKKFKSEKDELQESVKSYRQKMPDMAILSKIKAWHLEKQNLGKQILELTNEINDLKEDQGSIITGVRDLFTEPVFEGLAKDADLQAAGKFLAEKGGEIKAKIQDVLKETDNLRVKLQLGIYAENLEEGKPCPLCGSLHHPEIYSTESVQKEVKKLEEFKQTLEQESAVIDEKNLQLRNFENQLKFTGKVLEERVKKQKVINKSHENHDLKFEWHGFKELSEVENAFKEAEIIQKEIRSGEAGLEKITKELESAHSDRDRFKTETERIKTNITVYETGIKTLEEQLIIISRSVYKNRTKTEIETERLELLEEYAVLEKQYTDLTEKISELRKAKDTLTGNMEVVRRDLKHEENACKEFQRQLEVKLANSEYESAAAVKEILSMPIDPEKQKMQLAEFNNNLSLASSRVEELQNELAGREYDDEAHNRLTDEILKAGELRDQMNQEKGKTGEMLKKLREDLEKLTMLSGLLNRLHSRAENIKTLKLLFKGSGFVNYISSVFLQNLCSVANERFFQLTKQKLSLEITEDNNFQVRDYLNGGKTRNVKTLSGGQTFQAALSLALALADNIQKITESDQNFFFLDEGFGSLDNEALSVVFETLKSLRRENRIVGVISHVEEMQQEIEVHLRIENDEDKGSLIYKSWEG